MAIGFSHGSANWPGYTSFHDFRRRVGLEVGIDLDQMDGFGGTRSWEGHRDPLSDFLAMSDTDGKLEPAQLEPITVRLAEVVGRWSVDDPDRVQTLQLIAGMRTAISKREPFRVVPSGRKRR